MDNFQKQLAELKATRFEDKDFKVTTNPWGAWCVEVAVKPNGIAVRDSKNPQAGMLTFTPGEWAHFIRGVRNGDFDPDGGVEANIP